jgi:hypothetical protein
LTGREGDDGSYIGKSSLAKVRIETGDDIEIEAAVGWIERGWRTEN